MSNIVEKEFEFKKQRFMAIVFRESGEIYGVIRPLNDNLASKNFIPSKIYIRKEVVGDMEVTYFDPRPVEEIAIEVLISDFESKNL
ncbi:hypothetical protein [Pseudovibrio exalbescens]|nr:hypothetical protein [Pseudovibrio exalbescens]